MQLSRPWRQPRGGTPELWQSVKLHLGLPWWRPRGRAPSSGGVPKSRPLAVTQGPCPGLWQSVRITPQPALAPTQGPCPELWQSVQITPQLALAGTRGPCPELWQGDKLHLNLPWRCPRCRAPSSRRVSNYTSVCLGGDPGALSRALAECPTNQGPCASVWQSVRITPQFALAATQGQCS